MSVYSLDGDAEPVTPSADPAFLGCFGDVQGARVFDVVEPDVANPGMTTEVRSVLFLELVGAGSRVGSAVLRPIAGPVGNSPITTVFFHHCGLRKKNERLFAHA